MTLKLKNKLAYIMLGSICTIIGLVFTNVFPLNADLDTVRFDTVAYRQLILVDSKKITSWGISGLTMKWKGNYAAKR